MLIEALQILLQLNAVHKSLAFVHEQRRDLGVKAPVLMMSGGWDTRKETEALSEGAVGYLHKPFGLRELDHLVALALGSAPRATSG